MNKMTIVDICLGQQHGHPLTKVRLWSPLPNPQLAETNSEPSKWHSSWMISQLSGGRLITLDCFHPGTCSILSFLKYKFNLDMDLSSAMLLQNYHPGTYRMSYPLTWYSIQHCFWPRNSLHNERSAVIGPVFMEFTGLPMFLTTLKQLPWWNSGMDFWRLSYGSSTVEIPCRAGASFSSRLYKLWIRTEYLVLFLR